ncbi:MAG: magnesium chelatase [Candidatus Harrisonbacteria bacterium CG10_big_fil_rev_8_21_14_0_10_42_17]|uniref:Magnesium chelatase n=1 Tax=Candidatus Harrisonbacteria bacterium CG10_big_fil_rev_8_21_14_0_10_42_17 TaxID=1974584 RepID=A0A2M6WIW1_9BACT|nr:MAG: magnesium chelatase [Candidatus Harrisonbacteria bacterium CG10_big_fil_rev_8_21_14_0_10_42_17]
MKNIAKVFSAELDGITAKLIEIETDINVGLHSFTIVGLGDTALKEAKERVNSALKNIGIKPPTRENRRIVVNLAPADIKKSGSQYDIGIALGYMLASNQLKAVETKDKLFVGELALDSNIRPINGTLSITKLAKKKGFREIYVPEKNAKEAAIIRGIKVIPIKDLASVIAHLEERTSIRVQQETRMEGVQKRAGTSIAEIKGQDHAKRALTIAGAGGHNLLMIGPPGTGKTMLAESLVSILPPSEEEEIIEMTQIYSAANMLEEKPFMGVRPFRAPHQTASPASVIGGGQTPRPGEVSLAHRGVLFLDELPEFRRDVLENLRQPIENGHITISRVKSNLIFPAKFSLVAAMNPCPCGYYGDEEKECTCAAYDVVRYQKKISGPLLDRIDLQINVPRVDIENLRAKKVNYEEGERIRENVVRARKIQKERLINLKTKFTNAELSSKECDDMIKFDADAEQFIGAVLGKAQLSPRGFYRILKVAQTIADLEGKSIVGKPELAESYSYRVRSEE